MNSRQILIKTGRELAKLGIDNPELESEILLRGALRSSDNFLFSHPEAIISNPDYQRFRRFVRKRKTGMPIAYIIGEKEFFGINFFINKNVLIPRPESEMLVEIALNFLKLRENSPQNIVDIGTGSGCLIISIAKTFIKKGNNFSYFATDVSENALFVARKNARRYQLLKEIKFIKSNLLDSKKIPKKIDLILANLPYIPKNHPEIDHQKLAFEPASALYGGVKGMELILKLVNQIKSSNRKPGLIVLEIFEDYAKDLTKKITKILSDYEVELLNDLAAKPRFISAKIINKS
jgi:release factor glutamine methyltransferase